MVFSVGLENSGALGFPEFDDRPNGAGGPSRAASQNRHFNAVTLAERFRQEGRQEGEIQSQKKALINLLDTRFVWVPAGLVDTISAIPDLPSIERLLRTAVVCMDLELLASSL